ncbi:hypothetical protein RHMOL_Rhmol01G0186500 [Rhododendron molle]|uniref:Uncharacterized protein n=1 Tax=Rhododendron molle TaxID=49168 RepID=A0ACC0Q3J7_RHOML|nr:hypothetical protein RHMOL_Rhmol01G0186500 [Rhododendron molle]
MCFESEKVVMFVNAGGEGSTEANCTMSFMADSFFQGGDAFQTGEHIVESGDHSLIYQSARLGNFCYRFNNMLPGDYYVDLHFVEIINTYGPKRMRVFNVFMQDEKASQLVELHYLDYFVKSILSDFDIFSIVGANKPLQLIDSRVSVYDARTRTRTRTRTPKPTPGHATCPPSVSVKDDGLIIIRFEGVNGSPLVSGICIRRAPKFSALPVKREHLVCKNCAAEIEVTSAQHKVMQMKSTAKYEKKIQELSAQCQRKSDECYQAWMSLTAANEQLEKVRMELDNKLFQTYSLDQTVDKQAENLRNISSKYECDKKFWAVAINNLQEKIKVMKEEHSQLLREAHECADSIPDLNKMVFAVQSLVSQCEDLKVKYNEEHAKRRKLYNLVQEAKGANYSGCTSRNIRVFCRCRPLSKTEVASGHATVVDFDAAKDGELGILTGGSTKKNFKFDRVYTPKDDQVDVFADASPLVISVLDGYNVCIFAYGQTGTGKTFTMEGIEQNRGVNYRTLEELFRVSKERSETFSYDISVSVLEVYNEQIRDLLGASPTSKKQWRLAKTDVQGDRLKEAQNINRSLSALGDVISALATKSSHIPYRNSKLTHLLQDSLGGDSKTLMFVQISPSEHDLSETLSSLNFATRARGVELCPAKKQIDTSELQKLKMMVKELEKKLKEQEQSESTTYQRVFVITLFICFIKIYCLFVPYIIHG